MQFAPASESVKARVAKRAIGQTALSKRGIAAFAAAPLLLVLGVTQAQAAKTGTWTLAPLGATTSNGVGVSVSSTTAFTTPAAGVMATTNFWNDPYAAAPTNSIPGSADIDFITQPVATQTVTITFAKAVDNPVLHIERLGGTTGGLTNSSNWQLAGSNLGTLPTLARLSGNPQFRVVGNAFFRTSGVTSGATGCSVASATATADDGTNGCGSVRITGTGITTLSFTVTYVGGAGAGDGLEMVWSTGGSRISVAKQSTFGTRAFAFTGTNGLTSVSLDTAIANPQTSSQFDVVDHRQPITITETAVSDYVLTGATCLDQTAAVVPSTLVGQTLSIVPASYRANQTIVCTFSNRRTPASDLRITKTNGATFAYSGSTIVYTVNVHNDGPDAITGALVRDIPGAGITCPAGNSVTITGNGVPSGSFTISNLTGSGIALGTLTTGQFATLTYSCQVN